MYVVYTRSQVPQVALMPGDRTRSDATLVPRALTGEVLFLKLTYWIGLGTSRSMPTGGAQGTLNGERIGEKRRESRGTRARRLRHEILPPEQQTLTKARGYLPPIIL